MVRRDAVQIAEQCRELQAKDAWSIQGGGTDWEGAGVGELRELQWM